jgi:DNA-binding transcriptional MerR regulator
LRSGAGTPARDTPDAAPPVEEDATAPIDLSVLKSGKLYYRIGEVSQITGVKPYVLRYWESEFRLMAPQKSRSKQRLYRQKDIETILHIKRLLYEERYTIAGARQRLRELGAAGVRASTPSEATARPERESQPASERGPAGEGGGSELRGIRDELIEIRSLLSAEL